MFNKRTLLITSLTAALALSVTAVGLHASQAQDSASPTTVTINMNEYSFLIDGQAIATPLTLKTGTLYNLTIKNTGNMGHEIWFGKDVKKQNGRIDGYSTNLFTGVDMAVTLPTKGPTPLEIDTTAFYEVYLNPTESVQLAFTLPASAAGNWELGCFQLLPTATTMAAGTPAATMAATAAPAATMSATAAGTANAAAPSPSHYDVGMKLPLIVQ